MFNPTKRGEIWRYFTHSFLHSNQKHLWINVILLLLAGIPLEMYHDGQIVSLIFVGGTVLGAFLSYAAEASILCGASAGVYAIIFTHIGNTLINGDVFQVEYLFASLLMNLPLIGLMIYDGVKIATDSIPGGTSYYAHFAGIITGLTLGTAIIRNAKSQGWEKALRYTCMMIFVLIGVSLVSWHIYVVKCCMAAFVENHDFSVQKRLKMLSWVF